MAFLFRLMYAYFENKAILKVASGVRDKKERKCDCHSEKRLYLCTRVGNIVRTSAFICRPKDIINLLKF